jgi:hypothetical protein
MDTQYFAYTACDDLEDWVQGDIDFWDEPTRCRFRKKYNDGVFFIAYDYDTSTLHETNKLCMIPYIFHTDHPENILADLVLTIDYLINKKNVCVTFFKEDQESNTRLLHELQAFLPDTTVKQFDYFTILTK